MTFGRLAIALACTFAATATIAQESNSQVTASATSTSTSTSQPVATTTPVPSPTERTLRANSLVALRMLKPVSSETYQRGQTFELEVSEDVIVDGSVVIPAGSIATGQVIHAAKSGRMGKAGELMITSRYVTVGERQIKLRSLLTGTGQNRTDLAMGVAFVAGLASLFIRGKELVVPAETELVARIANDEAF